MLFKMFRLFTWTNPFIYMCNKAKVTHGQTQNPSRLTQEFGFISQYTISQDVLSAINE